MRPLLRQKTLHNFNILSDRKHNSGCLLSAESAQDLKLISLQLNAVSSPAAPKIQPIEIDSKDQQIQEIVNSHSNVFTGIGMFKDSKIKLNIDEETVPISHPQRRVPYHIRGKMAHAVEKLEAQ